MPVLQDGPPPGGFAPVRYARRIPTKGPSAMAIFLAAFGAFSWGMYEVGKGNKIRRSAFLYIRRFDQNLELLHICFDDELLVDLFLNAILCYLLGLIQNYTRSSNLKD